MQGRNGEVFCLGMYASAANKRTNRRKARAREIHVKMYVSRLTTCMYMILKAAGTLLTKNIGEQWPFRAVVDSCLPAMLQRRGLICF